jgi:hypothetical protein
MRYPVFAGFFLSKQRCILLVITQNSNQFSVPVFPAWVKVEHVQCLKSHPFSNSCAKNRHDLLAKIVGKSTEPNAARIVVHTVILEYFNIK